MGYREVTLKFDNLAAFMLGQLLLKGTTLEFMAKNGEEPVKVSMRNLSNHSLIGKTHTFEAFLTTVEGSFHGHITATFKETNDDFLHGEITYHKYPPDNMSE